MDIQYPREVLAHPRQFQRFNTRKIALRCLALEFLKNINFTLRTCVFFIGKIKDCSLIRVISARTEQQNEIISIETSTDRVSPYRNQLINWLPWVHLRAEPNKRKGTEKGFKKNPKRLKQKSKKASLNKVGYDVIHFDTTYNILKLRVFFKPSSSCFDHSIQQQCSKSLNSENFIKI